MTDNAKQQGKAGGKEGEPEEHAKKEAPEDKKVPEATPSEEKLDQASEESFPASDAPSWTPVRTVKSDEPKSS